MVGQTDSDKHVAVALSQYDEGPQSLSVEQATPSMGVHTLQKVPGSEANSRTVLIPVPGAHSQLSVMHVYSPVDEIVGQTSRSKQVPVAASQKEVGAQSVWSVQGVPSGGVHTLQITPG
eukprot:CAMPEP_0194039702 /NCGR_PEP_ID=MMETSP0009_2-20130614/11820_1 /TAXON_ID=210454 /ORGANISM="Grammatophora oceanica, Strain CCMP 410" /LENGTH=118 /DNA_ID=CAMNT_0038682627 /DNA_START=809 /DNA_END=1165 /DNA_ORIENTATION=-